MPTKGTWTRTPMGLISGKVGKMAARHWHIAMRDDGSDPAVRVLVVTWEVPEEVFAVPGIDAFRIMEDIFNLEVEVKKDSRVPGMELGLVLRYVEAGCLGFYVIGGCVGSSRA